MKKLLLFVALAITSLSASAQTVDKVIEKYKASSTAQCMTVTKDMINMMSAMASASGQMSDEDREMMELLKNLDSMTTLMEEDISREKADEFLSDLQNALKKDWTIATEAAEEDDQVIVATKKKKAKDDYYSELVVGAVKEKQMMLLYFMGKITEDKIEGLIKMGQ